MMLTISPDDLYRLKTHLACLAYIFESIDVDAISLENIDEYRQTLRSVAETVEEVEEIIGAA